MEVLVDIRFKPYVAPCLFTKHQNEAEHRNAIKRAIFKTVNEAYNESTDDPDTYLHQPESDDDIECVFGADDPERIVSTALRWNERIRDNFVWALRELEARRAKNGGEYPIDNAVTYQLKKAAMALDNHFYDFADYAVLIDNYLEVTLTEEMIEAIKAEPEYYAIIEVWPK